MFQPEDFQKLAFELPINANNFSCGESSLSRTSISRTYYFMFLEIREIIISKLNDNNKFIFTSQICRKKHHYIIQKILYQIEKMSRNPKIKVLAENLAEYREKRNEADYEIEIIIRFPHFFELTQNFEEVKEAIEELRKIKKEIFYQAFEKIKSRCEQ